LESPGITNLPGNFTALKLRNLSIGAPGSYTICCAVDRGLKAATSSRFEIEAKGIRLRAGILFPPPD
jgi:hypothetical protein